MKKAIITGGTGGLGSAIATHLLSHHWQVLQLSRQNLDLSTPSAIHTYFSSEPCDLLICAAGIIRDQPLSTMESHTWDQVFQVNYTAAHHCAEAALPAMVKKGKGHIIFISSYAAIHPAIGQAAYATAKAALHGLTKTLAHTHGKNGIRINTILPGFLETPMTSAVSEKRRKIIKSLHTLDTLNTPQVAAGFIHYLHEHMPHTSGQIFSLDSRP